MTSTACVGEGRTGTASDDETTTSEPPIAGSTSTSSPTTTLAAVPTTSALTAEQELEAALIAGERTPCTFENATRDIARRLGDEPALEHMGLYADSGDAALVLSALLGKPFAGPLWWPFTTATPETAKFHAQLFANHERPVTALRVFLDSPAELLIDGAGDPLINPPENVIAVWDGFEIAYSNGETVTLPALGILRDPDPRLEVSQEARVLVWERIDAWVTQLLDEIGTYPDPPWHGVVGLEAAELSTAMVPLLCVALAAEWRIADEAASETLLVVLREDPSIFFRELAVQELLLAVEYLEEIEEHLSQPGIDWFRGDSVDESQAADGVTSSSEYVYFWYSAALDVLARYQAWLSEARPLGSP